MKEAVIKCVNSEESEIKEDMRIKMKKKIAMSIKGRKQIKTCLLEKN